MSLQHELGLKTGFRNTEHEALLSVYYTASLMKKQAAEFFRGQGLTDVQFNVMMLLVYQSTDQEGLNQADLSRMMLVNRANITTLIDRMEKAGIVKRTAAPDDRRSNIIKITDKGKKLFKKVEPLYIRMVHKTMKSLRPEDQNRIIKLLGILRQDLY